MTGAVTTFPTGAEVLVAAGLYEFLDLIFVTGVRACSAGPGKRALLDVLGVDLVAFLAAAVIRRSADVVRGGAPYEAVRIVTVALACEKVIASAVGLGVAWSAPYSRALTGKWRATGRAYGVRRRCVPSPSLSLWSKHAAPPSFLACLAGTGRGEGSYIHRYRRPGPKRSAAASM